MLGNYLEIKVSEHAVRRALQESELKAIIKEPKPLLSTKNIKARVQLAKRYKYWTKDDWKSVIWPDGPEINRFCSDWCT